MGISTIYALSSAAGRAGVAVIRVSGPGARRVAVALCGREPTVRRAELCRLRLPEDGRVVDDALVLFFEAPASFTGEDVVEFQVHGSLAVIRCLLRWLATQPDFRLAQPGEFARRALLNGKLDLLDVESLGDLLSAETELQRRMALEGSNTLRSLAEAWRGRLLELRAWAEAEIDFADEGDVQDRLDSDTQRPILELADAMDSVTARLAVGQRIRRGFRIAVLGPPNAGKSSLVNALADRDAAIVSALPGTTRDALEVPIDLDGVPVTFVDTAGLREKTIDPIESEGIRRSRLAAKEADFVIWASEVDSLTEPPFAVDLVVRTKADLAPGWSGPDITVSVRDGQGIADLIQMVRDRALDGGSDASVAGLIAHERQASALARSAMALRAAGAGTGLSLDMRAEELRIASAALDSLIGRIDHEEVLGVIFSRFCIGK